MKKQPEVYYKTVADLELFSGKFKIQTFPWHYHHTYTLIMVEHGFIEYVLEDRRVIVSAGQIYLVNAFQAHYNTSFDCSYKVFFIPPIFLNADGRVLQIFDTRYTYSNTIIFNQLRDIHRALEREKNTAYYASARETLTTLLYQMFPVKQYALEREDRIESVIHYIDHHLGEKLTAAELSKISALSVFHFQRKFKDNTGLTLNAYIQQKRMEKGRMYLRSGYGVASAALESGYFDQSHFHHRFLKMYGLTPKQFASIQ